ncbi:cupin domain-containing protein [Pedobacter sp.]|uniref:cupin domain-containing protein n=1 Tax=Pedobacter sp. TaxID=1411316 RepID=UPI0031DD397B
MNRTIINPVIKDEVTFVHTSSETNGEFSELEVKLMPGGGTPMHYHRNFDEVFMVTQGELTLYLRNQKIKLKPHGLFTVKKGKAHRFTNESDQPVHFTTVIKPGYQGFENALSILYGLASDGKTNHQGIPLSLLELAVVSKMSDMNQSGIMSLLSPLMTLLNKVAKRKKIDQQLIERFCNY